MPKSSTDVVHVDQTPHPQDPAQDDTRYLFSVVLNHGTGSVAWGELLSPVSMLLWHEINNEAQDLLQSLQSLHLSLNEKLVAQGC